MLRAAGSFVNRDASFDAGCRVVAMGGGTGLSALLRGLRRRVSRAHGFAANSIELQPCVSKLTAMVAVADDDGSSGRLRCDSAMPPPRTLLLLVRALFTRV